MDLDTINLWPKLSLDQILLVRHLVDEKFKMTTLIPSSQPTGVEAYEDMFKEITRKLYGEETGHGLHTLGTPVAHVATGGPTAPEGERSFTTLISDRSLATIDYDHVGSDTSNLFKSDDHLTTAFGLAALMQNGFPPPGAILNPHNFVTNKPNSIITSTASTVGNTVPTVATEDKWPAASTDDCLPWATNKSNFNVPQKIFKVKKQEHIDHDLNIPQQSNNVQSNNVKAQSNSTLNASQSATNGLKRYNCSSCPYSTDRRDLFTRHENIHKEEKPFHCYVCLKQFNRADHVKKHFLRMHRGLAYDLSRTKRSTANGRKTTNFFVQQPKQEPNQQNYQQATTLTIPTNTYQSAQHQQQNQAQQHQPNQTQQHQQNQGQQQQQQNTNHNDNNQNPGSGQIIPQQITNLKVEKIEKKPKIKGEKRFICCYCPWSGTDNWGLKRHLNTHTKPYVCMLCDYKAARSERLATHVFKVHNKKVCGKCNFLADNQEEYQTHINEAHAHDTRPQRCLTSNAESTANVLRTIGNSFNIPNSQLNTIHNVATGHSFGNSSSNNQSNNIYTNNVTTTNSMSDNLVASNNPNLGNSWRTASTTAATIMSSGVESTSSTQKRGAERLFQYMEADGSDPEDYTRQLQMAALSRNTASVAQDFHNAGGGVKTFTNNHSAEENYRQIIAKHSKQSASSKSPSKSKPLPSTPKWIDFSMASPNVSPPATNPIPDITMKKRRSTYNKENTENVIPSRIQCNQGDQVTNLKLHFDNYIREQFYNPKKLTSNFTDFCSKQKSFTFDSHPELEVSIKSEPSDDERSMEHPEVEVIIKEEPIDEDRINGHPGETELTVSIKSEPIDGDRTMEKRNRKQTQPRKIEQIDEIDTKPVLLYEQTALNNIRDKHLARMVSRKKCCFKCKNRNKFMVLSYHTTASLILHMKWRHGHEKRLCEQWKCERVGRYLQHKCGMQI